MERVLDASTIEWEIPSPVSLSTVILLHLVFLVQWNKRKRRKTITINYRTFIEKKRFHRLWVALLSHPAPTSSLIENWSCLRMQRNHADSHHHTSDRVVEMGGAEFQQRQGILQSRTMQCWIVLNSIREAAFRIDGWMTSASLGAAPLLIYNCHIVWSCRALEEEYNQPFHSHWNYARILLCWGVLTYLIELALYRLVIRRLDEVSPRRASSDFQADSLTSMRNKLLNRPLSTPISLTAAMVLVFHLQYPFVSPQIIPLLGNPQFLDRFPAFSYFLCILVLTVVSYRSHSITAIASGGFIGLLWWYTGFLVQPYWNIPFCFVFCIITIISARVDRRYGKNRIPCIDRVALNHDGNILVQNEQGQWVPMDSEGDHFENEHPNDDRSDSSDSTDLSNELEAFPPTDDEEMFGFRLPGDDNDLESPYVHRRGNQWTELVPLRLPLSSGWASRMRSRRGTTPH